MNSTDAAKSSDLATVCRFKDWLVSFAKENVKPYVNPKVYGEVLNQMTRGLAEHTAELQTQKDMQALGSGQKHTAPLVRVR